MVLVGFSAQALASDGDPPDCECPRMCDLTDVAIEKLDTAFVLIKKPGLFDRSKGRLELNRAKIKIIRAKVALVDCGISELWIEGILDMIPGMSLEEFIELIEWIVPILPDMLKIAAEDIKPEMLMTASIMAIDHAIIETFDGLTDPDALDNILLSKKILLLVQEVIGCETCVDVIED